MAKRLWIFTFGLCCLMGISQGRTVISCRFKGVFHVEKNDRYFLNRDDANNVCRELNCTIANITQMQIAHQFGFETCRYGWIEDRIVIPRTKPNPICAANHTGIFILSYNVSLTYDAYCFNASETADKSCDPVVLTESADFPQVSIDSYDPTLDLQNPYRNQDSDKNGFIRDSVTDPVPPILTSDSREGFGDEEGNIESYGDSNPYTTNEEVNESTEQPFEDNIGHSGYHESHGSHNEHPVPNEHEDHGDYTDTDFTERPYEVYDSTLNGRHHDRETDYTNDKYPTRPDDEKSIQPNNYPRSLPYVTDSPIDPYEDHNDDRHDNEHDDSKPNKGRKSSHDSSTHDFVTGQPKRQRGARIPDWLIVLVSLLVLGLILSVCLAINTRKLCGQKKKLVINGNNARLEGGEAMEHNGDTLKSQEMVQLVSQESGNQDGHMTGEDKRRNEKDVDMKIGV